MNQSAISNETQQGQLQRDIDILKNWNGDRGTDQVRTALGNVLNCFENPQVIQALQQGQSQTRSASAGSGGMGYQGINST